MPRVCLEFEKPFAKLEDQIRAMEEDQQRRGVDLSAEIRDIRKNLFSMIRKKYSALTPWEIVQVARHPDRPQTADYIDKVLTRLTLWGALYVTAVCLLPEILVSSQGVPFHFGGTYLLIVVVVVMDFMSQLQAHMMSHHYPGLLKKANLLGYGRSGSGG